MWQGIKDVFTFLFVPDEDIFDDLSSTVQSKLPLEFFDQVKTLFDTLFSEKNYDETGYPEFSIDYYGHHKIIDFGVFDQYRGTLHAIIIFVAWAMFLMKIGYKIVGIISNTATR